MLKQAPKQIRAVEVLHFVKSRRGGGGGGVKTHPELVEDGKGYK